MKFWLAVIVSLTSVLLICAPPRVVAQGSSDPAEMAEIVTDALSVADSKALSDLSAGQVDLDLGEGSSVYTRDQARYVFTSFFRDHPPSDVSLGDVSMLQGTSTVRGTYHALDSNEPWRVFIRLSSIQGTWKLKEVRLSHDFLTPNSLPPVVTPYTPPH
jgi:hypothetical protein